MGRKQISNSEKKNARDSPLSERIEISWNFSGSAGNSGGGSSDYGVSGDDVSGVPPIMQKRNAHSC